MNKTTIKKISKEINKPRLRRIIREIEKYPERFDMREFHGLRCEDGDHEDFRSDQVNTIYSCKTTHCVAGWGQLLWARDKRSVKELDAIKRGNETFEDNTSTGIPIDTEEAGVKWLGLSLETAALLFYDFKVTVEDLKEIAK